MVFPVLTIWTAVLSFPQHTSIPPTFIWPLKLCAAVSVTSWLLSVITGNCSQVDRIWTFMPTIYTAYFALLPLWPDAPLLPLWPYAPKEVPAKVTNNYSPRALLMLGLVTIWMFRLTYNTHRRGLFSLDDEDYRWPVLRKQMPPWVFQIFNLVFIAAMQNIILFLLGIPTQMATIQPHEPLTFSDYVLGGLALGAIGLEFLADNQQYAYQMWKHSGGKHDVMREWPGARTRFTQEDMERGFLTRGLWAWSRHPNFLCEQSFWIIINFIPLVSAAHPRLPARPIHEITSLAPLTPVLVLTLLFFSSTRFTEQISLPKYPKAYAAYQQRVAMFVPILTPVWGLLLYLQGKKKEVDSIVYGTGEASLKAKAE